MVQKAASRGDYLPAFKSQTVGYDARLTRADDPERLGGKADLTQVMRVSLLPHHGPVVGAVILGKSISPFVSWRGAGARRGAT